MEPTILLADDHIMISKGLRKSIEFDFGFSYIKSVTSCVGILQELKKERYTHLIVDIGLSDGSSLEIMPVIRGMYPGLNIMVFSAKPAGTYARVLKSFGIQSYLSKQDDEEVTRGQLRKFLYNEAPLPIQVQDDDDPFACLTKRELEILHQLLEGKGTNEIASALNITASTVSIFKKLIFEKTKTTNFRELSELASFYNLN